jgi:hypothetical protein
VQSIIYCAVEVNLLTLDCFIAEKEIYIDAAGWGDLLLGVVIGAIKPPNPMLMERRISTASFQPPNFSNKKYLTDAVKIAEEIVAVMQPNESTCFKVSSEYVLSGVIKHLQQQGYNVQKVQTTGELKAMVQRGYVRWCIEAGVPEDLLRDQKRFWPFLKWVAEKPHLRESIVKTGWASWQNRWRTEIYSNPKIGSAKNIP